MDLLTAVLDHLVEKPAGEILCQELLDDLRTQGVITDEVYEDQFEKYCPE